MSQLREMVKQQIEERCQKGYKTHEKRKTKKMFGKSAAQMEAFSGNAYL